MTSLLYVGFIKKTHGFNGAVKIHSEDLSLKLTEKEPLLLEINKKVVPFFIEHLSKTAAEWHVKFEDIKSLEDADEIIGLSVYMEANQVHQQDAWQADAVGYNIIDQALGPIGEVIAHIRKPGQDLLEISLDSKTYFIPFVDELILKFDNKKGIIHTKLPEGLLNIND